MSKEIICRECNTPNTPGSKFCKSCGTLLPPSTSLICPNCQRSNPNDRLYCDNCGTRLVQHAQFTSEKPEAEEPPLNHGKTFSLPIRLPGDTGELDPAKAVPDWLRGKTQSAEDPTEEDDSPQKSTGDLPDWLVDELDSKPIVSTPDHVSTEDYLNLIQEPESESKAGEEETAVQADLPDWLTDLASPSESEQTTIPDDKSTSGEFLTAWLTDTTQTDDEDGEQSTAADTFEEGLTALSQSDVAPSDLDDFGVGDDDETTEEPTDWLAELSEPGADALTDLDIGTLDESSTSQSAMEGEVFDWLAETLIKADKLVDLPDETLEPTAIDEIPPSKESMADWLDIATETAVSEPEPSTTDESEKSDSAIGIPEQFDKFLADEDESWLDELTPADESAPTLSESDEPELTIESEQPEIKDSEPQPDWLTDLGEESLVADVAKDDVILTSLLTLDETGDTGLDWFTDDETESSARQESESIESTEESPGSESGMDWLAELEALDDEAYEEEETAVAEEAYTKEPVSEESAPALTEDIFASDWPEDDDVADVDPEAVAEEAVAEEAVAEEAVAEEAVAEEASAELDAFAESETPEIPEKHDSGWLHADTMLSNALQDELPDWLDELGALTTAKPTPDQDDADDIFLPGDMLPGWIEQMKPGTVYSGSGLSTPSRLPDISEPLSDLPDDLVGAELPDWLQNAADTPGLAETSILSIDDSPDIPNWLRADSDESTQESGLLGLGSQPQFDDSSDDWADVLQELPKAAESEDRIIQADVPDWIRALKPRVLSGADPEPEPEKTVQDVGPLSGIRDVINIEPIIAQPRSNGALQSFTITNEQQAQAALLKQLALTRQVTTDPSVTTSAASLVWVRVLLASLLLAAIGIGLFRPNLLPRARLFTPPHVTMAHSAVQDAAGQPVLLAVEYTPALAGELDAQAEMLIAQLAANGSPVLTVSQYTAGTAVAHNLAGDQPSLGLVPGESVGLRQLGNCLSDAADCSTMTGRNLDRITQQTLADVGLIIVLTGERDSLVNWVEQVGRTSEIPIMAGVTQSLGPVAAPYFDSGQLQGMIVGLPNTAVYQQEFLSTSTDDINRQLSAQTLGQLVIALLLLLGGLSYGAAGLFKRGKSSQV